MRSYRPVLLVEDDRIDAATVQRAFQDLEVTNPVAHILNGKDALAHLSQEATERPCIIFLDLNMPEMNGFEFLRIIKADRELRKIPVVVLTTSSERQDVIASFQMGVAGYIVKPIDYPEFVEAIKAFDMYWALSMLPDDKVESRNGEYRTSVAGGGRRG
jgi:CheY-like chemotaxis protein